MKGGDEVAEVRKAVNRVKEIRARHNLTQAELAEKAGVHEGTIALIEKGATNPKRETMVSIVKAFNELEQQRPEFDRENWTLDRVFPYERG